MKRAGNLTIQICDLKNLYSAYFKATKTKRKKQSVIAYHKNLQNNIKQLQNQIMFGNVEIGNYTYFTIYEPKERLICAASFAERVLHHAIMNVCHQYFENRQIFDSYATRTNKGTYKALERAVFFAHKNKYYLKLYIRKYFDSISHKILYQKLETLFKDSNLLYILYQIIDSYHTKINYGLPIGNLTSQYFANFYLTFIDRFAKDVLHTKYYIRYMDDIVIFSDDLLFLQNISEKIEFFLEKELNLFLKINYINTTQSGLNFLGYRVFNNRIELQTKSKKRFIKKMSSYYYKLEKGIFTQKEFQRHVIPLISYTEHASAKGFRKKVFNNSFFNI
jgi:hypothetical protein